MTRGASLSVHLLCLSARVGEQIEERAEGAEDTRRQFAGLSGPRALGTVRYAVCDDALASIA